MTDEAKTDDTKVVSQRLMFLRKHLGESLGLELTLPMLAERCGLTDYFIQRLENGLKGNMHSLLKLLLYYRSQGYSLDWILVTDNSQIPMIVPAGEALFNLNNEVLKLSQVLHKSYTGISEKLHTMGYHSLDSKSADITVVESLEPMGLEF